MENAIGSELIVKNCFNSWLTKDSSAFKNSFAENVVYVESHGPAYEGIKQVTEWFSDWNGNDNHVLTWDIKKFHHFENTCVCEWYFECKCGGSIDGFDGVSIITFDSENKIATLKEFQSKTPNHYPYSA
jgi:hypothetical protein